MDAHPKTRRASRRRELARKGPLRCAGMIMVRTTIEVLVDGRVTRSAGDDVQASTADAGTELYVRLCSATAEEIAVWSGEDQH